MDKERLLNAIKNAEEYAKYYQENDLFDPFKVLTNTETYSDKIYRASVDFLSAIENAMEEYQKARTYKITTFN
jgi:hypothetical protein